MSQVNLQETYVAGTSKTSPPFLFGAGTVRVQGIVEGTGAVAAQAVLQGSNVPANSNSWETIGTLALTGTSPQKGNLDVDTKYAYGRVVISGITGTGAVLYLGVATTATGSSGGGGGGGDSGDALTDAELRASAVPVTGPLTDALLRATAVPVSVSGGATAAAQATEIAALTTIAGYVDQLEGYVDGLETAIAAGNSSLATLATNLPAKGAALAAASTPVTLATDGQFVTSIGTKITAADALGAGGLGLIGWLSSLYQQTLDYRPAPVTISAVDVGSASTASTPITGNATINIISGTPTALSFAQFAVNGLVEALIQVAGMTAGSLVFEGSADGGVTFQSMPAHVTGINRETSTINGAGQFILPCGGRTHIRLRCTVIVVGTTIVTAVFSKEGTLIKGNGGEIALLPNSFSSVCDITRPANTTAYAAMDVYGGVLTFPMVGPNGGSILINSASLRLDIAALPSGIGGWLLFLFSATPPSAIADNSPFTLPSGDRPYELGSIDLGTGVLYTSTVKVQTDGIGKQVRLAAGNQSLFGYLVTKNAFTSANNSETARVILNSIGV